VRVSPQAWHKCLADPTCGRRVRKPDWCCGQHKALLGVATGDWRLAAEVTSAWRCRLENPNWYYAAKQRALDALKQFSKEKADVDPNASGG
jgi:hypothetical protein